MMRIGGGETFLEIPSGRGGVEEGLAVSYPTKLMKLLALGEG